MNSKHDNLGLSICNDNLVQPLEPQRFILSWNRNIKINSVYGKCIDVYKVSLVDCHFSLGNQYFRYDLVRSLKDVIL